MLDVNDDMDELFRRAAESYPLKTDTSDWQKVEQNLAASAPEIPVRGRAKNKNWLLLLLLFPLVWLCNNYNHKADKNLAAIENASTTKLQTANKTDNEITSKANKSLAKSFTKKQVDARHNALVRKTGNKSNTFKHRLLKRDNTRIANSKKHYPHNALSFTHITSGALTKDKANGQKNELPVTEKTKNDAVKNLQAMEANAQPKEAEENTSVKTDDTILKDTLLKDVSDNKIKERKKSLHLYAGIIGNADVSTVKFQSTKTPGLGAGIIAGYQLTKKLSVESGFYYQKKFYYTDAKYYNPKKAYTSATHKLLNVNGNCSMFELPLNLKYNFKTSAKHSWFVVSGFSSYIMKAENYDYTYEGNGQLSYWHMAYNNSSSSWFTVINANIGYERKAGKTGTLRIEPYLKLPVKGYGWGRLPIMSSGLNVGYIKHLF